MVGQTSQAILEKKCRDALRWKKSDSPEIYSDRLEYELSVIGKLEFASYFLVLWELVSWARSKEIRIGEGRGSAAGSLVSYLLGITRVDPIRYNLIFERFLNPHRVAPPDIDLDFAEDRRHEVVEHLRERFGRDKVANIITFGRLKARGAVRDVGRAIGVSLSEVEQIAKMIDWRTDSFDSAFRMSRDLEMARQQYHELFKFAEALEGRPRHSSMHAAGVVILRDNELCPLQTVRGELVTQWDMYDLEELGIMKIDILGLKTLKVLDDISKMTEIDLEEIDFEDFKVYKMLNSDSLWGIFQLDTSFMVDIVREVGPTCFEDLVAILALARPGSKDYISDYIRGKAGGKVAYLHKSLRPILERTYGVMIYQEQTMRIAHECAGFTLTEADEMRKVIAKTHRGMKKFERKFVGGCISNGFSSSASNRLWERVTKSERYSFNRSHAVCYSRLAFRMAWLKTYHPLEFLCCSINSDIKNQVKVKDGLRDLKHLEFCLEPYDVRTCGPFFKIGKREDSLVPGLLSIKGLGLKMIDGLNGDGDSLDEFMGLNPKLRSSVFKLLAKSGCLDFTGVPRGGLLKSKISSRPESLFVPGVLPVFGESRVESKRKMVDVTDDFLGDASDDFHEREVLGFSVKDFL